MTARRSGLSLVELLVVMAIVAILFGLVTAAAQRVRAAAARLQCANNLRQIGLALHQYHDTQHSFPPAVAIDDPHAPYDHLSWRIRLMPFLDQEAFWRETQRQYAANPRPFLPPYHANAGVTFAVFSCPVDGRLDSPHPYGPLNGVALSSYLGVEGINYQDTSGILYRNSRTRMLDVLDGLSNTLLIGERPPSNHYRYGWLYSGSGQAFSGSLDHCLGVREIAGRGTGCPPGPYHFEAARLGVPCAFMHFWSLHDGGSHFLLADGEVRFLAYSVDPLLPALATRAGSEAIGADWY